jgi:hypothetical protein
MPKTGFSSEDELWDRALQRVERMWRQRDVRNRIKTETSLLILGEWQRSGGVLSDLFGVCCI